MVELLINTFGLCCSLDLRNELGAMWCILSCGALGYGLEVAKAVVKPAWILCFWEAVLCSVFFGWSSAANKEHFVLEKSPEITVL